MLRLKQMKTIKTLLLLSRNKNCRIVDILISAGAKFNQDNIEIARELSIAATDNDVERLQLWKMCGVNMNMVDMEGRSPLHVVSFVLFGL